MTNMNTRQIVQAPRKVARMLRTLGQPTRLRILLALAEGEACVCHLESLMGLRQAYISQHLMALRKAGLVIDRREGRFIFYRLKDPKTLELIRLAEQVASIPDPIQLFETQDSKLQDCVCPSCSSAT